MPGSGGIRRHGWKQSANGSFRLGSGDSRPCRRYRHWSATQRLQFAPSPAMGSVLVGLRALQAVVGLDEFWSKRLPASREGTSWSDILETLVCYRLIAPGSEWKLHRQWFEQSAMGDLLGHDYSLVEKNALYRAHDRVANEARHAVAPTPGVAASPQRALGNDSSRSRTLTQTWGGP